MKQIPAALLGLVLLLSPKAATAQQYGDFEYTNNGNAVTITDYTGNGGAVTIPSTINGLPVTIIGGVAANAFAGSIGLVSVTIPSSVSQIGWQAFVGCSALTNVFFLGNAPDADPGGSVFLGDPNATVYYLPGTTGWDWQPFGRPPLGYPNYEYLPAVLWNPRAQSPALRSGQFSFDITGTPDIPIVIEAATNLTNGAWVPLQTGLLSGGLLHFTDPSWTSFPARFYRIRWP
jgi:hypothetical protein